MLGINVGCVSAQNDKYTNLDTDEFATLLQDKADGVQLLDVRTPQEYAEGHLEGATNIDIFDPHFLTVAEKTLDKSKPVAVYCRSGRRSADTANLLAANGYTVYNLTGGILSWQHYRKPTIK